MADRLVAKGPTMESENESMTLLAAVSAISMHINVYTRRSLITDTIRAWLSRSRVDLLFRRYTA